MVKMGGMQPYPPMMTSYMEKGGGGDKGRMSPYGPLTQPTSPTELSQPDEIRDDACQVRDTSLTYSD